jgi:hypothetical protein
MRYMGVPIPILMKRSGFQFLISSSCGVRSTTARSKMMVLSSAFTFMEANCFFVSSIRPTP